MKYTITRTENSICAGSRECIYDTGNTIENQFLYDAQHLGKTSFLKNHLKPQLAPIRELSGWPNVLMNIFN